MFQYQIDYAKSCKSRCKTCKQKIFRNELRIAYVVKSKGFLQSLWNHERCFFKKGKRFAHFTEFENFNTLEHKDQIRIKAQLVDPTEQNNCENDEPKNVLDDRERAILSDYCVEKSKTSNATCRVCSLRIVKDDLRVSKVEYSVRYGETAQFYHLSCFSNIRSEFQFSVGGEYMPGFELLSSEDKENVKNNIRPHAQKPTMKHKIVPERNTVRRNNDEEIRLQNDTFHKHKRALRALSKGELEILCKRNEMKLLKGTEEPLDLLADCMTFGVLQKCPECQGQLQLKSLNYECTGHRDEWSSCNYQTKKPRRKLMEIPPELQKYQAFKDYVPTLGERIFNDERLIEIHPPRPKKPRAANVHAPLKNVQFFIYGLKAERKEAVKRRVLRLGGRAVPQLVPTVAAVLSAPDALAKPSTLLEKIEIGGIHVIDEKYLDEIESTPGIELIGALSLIEKHNFADWAFDVLSRVPQDVVEGRPVKVSGNLCSPKSAKPEISTNKVKGDTTNGKRKSFKDAFDKYLDESTKNDTGQAAKTVEALPWGQDASFLQPYLAFVSPDSNVQSFNESEDSIYEEPGLQSQYPQASAQLTCELEVPGTLTQYPQTTTQHTHLRLNEPIISSPHTDQNNRKRTFDLNESQVDRFISLLNNRKDDMEHDETDLIFLGYARTLKQMSKRRQATVKFRIAKIIMEAELEDAEESNAPVMMPTQNNRNNTSENYIVNSAPQYNHGTTVQNHLSLEDTSLPRYTFANTLNDNAADFSNNESVSSVNFVVECLESLNSESNYFE